MHMSDCNKLLEEVEELNSKLADIEAYEASLKDDLRTAKGVVSRLETEASTLRGKTRDAKSKVASLETILDALNNQAAATKNKAAALQAKANALAANQALDKVKASRPFPIKDYSEIFEVLREESIKDIPAVMLVNDCPLALVRPEPILGPFYEQFREQRRHCGSRFDERLQTMCQLFPTVIVVVVSTKKESNEESWDITMVGYYDDDEETKQEHAKWIKKMVDLVKLI